MPTYVFRCQKCNVDDEIPLTISDRDKIIFCDECGKLMQRIILPINFILRGDGWPGKELKMKENNNGSGKEKK